MQSWPLSNLNARTWQAGMPFLHPACQSHCSLVFAVVSRGCAYYSLWYLLSCPADVSNLLVSVLQPLGASVARSKVLGALGYKAVLVPESEWAALKVQTGPTKA